jgi:hypothetical protein
MTGMTRSERRIVSANRCFDRHCERRGSRRNPAPQVAQRINVLEL